MADLQQALLRLEKENAKPPKWLPHAHTFRRCGQSQFQPHVVDGYVTIAVIPVLVALEQDLVASSDSTRESNFSVTPGIASVTCMIIAEVFQEWCSVLLVVPLLLSPPLLLLLLVVTMMASECIPTRETVDGGILVGRIAYHDIQSSDL